jgi:hypothetical protein
MPIYSHLLNPSATDSGSKRTTYRIPNPRVASNDIHFLRIPLCHCVCLTLSQFSNLCTVSTQSIILLLRQPQSTFFLYVVRDQPVYFDTWLLLYSKDDILEFTEKLRSEIGFFFSKRTRLENLSQNGDIL